MPRTMATSSALGAVTWPEPFLARHASVVGDPGGQGAAEVEVLHRHLALAAISSSPEGFTAAGDSRLSA